MNIDYLVLGSGLSALTISALLAKAGYKVTVIEAHEFPGGYGHTFVEGNNNYNYHFNAQLHYVWDCGEGELVHRVLKKLGIANDIKFVKYNENGFDRMNIPGYTMEIPSDYGKLNLRLIDLFPKDGVKINKFITHIQKLVALIDRMKTPSGKLFITHAIKNYKVAQLLWYYKATLQQVFDKFDLPKPVQTILASQWPDFMLPPNQLSFFCWLVLFDGYIRGAYYPQKHFEHVINSLVKVIIDHGGEIIYNQKVIKLDVKAKNITKATTQNTIDDKMITEYTAKNFICNFDPKQAAKMIGLEHFSRRVKKQLDYDYSYSNYVVYGAVKDIDLREHGFGNFNIFHTEQMDLNQVFDDMYIRSDYSKPAFVITSPSLVTDDPTGCPENHQIFYILTVANYAHFKDLKFRNNNIYIQKKKEIYNNIMDIIERKYVPNFREYISFKMLGSPTSNESFVYTPEGNSYGSNMTPRNMSLNRLSFNTSLKNFYFCNASAGFAGFASSFQNGANLYEYLTKDIVPAYI